MCIRDSDRATIEPILYAMLRKRIKIYRPIAIKASTTESVSYTHLILCVPKASGEYPAILKVPAAGLRAYNGEAERAGKGFIIMEIGIDGIPVNLTGDVYHRLYNGALKNYHSFNMDNRDKYYYKRVYTGCVRRCV